MLLTLPGPTQPANYTANV